MNPGCKSARLCYDAYVDPGECENCEVYKAYQLVNHYNKISYERRQKNDNKLQKQLSRLQRAMSDISE